MADAKKRGGYYIGTDGEPHDAFGNPIEEEEAQEEEESIFASPAAAELAEDEGLTADDFDGVEASGETGYTKADVEGVVKAQEEEE